MTPRVESGVYDRSVKRSNTTPAKFTEVEYELGQLLVVQWLDAHNLESGWQHVKDVKFTKAEVQTVGHFLAFEEKQLFLAGDWCEEDEMVNTVVGIPMGWITEIKVIENG